MSMRQLKISKTITTREEASLEKYLQEVNKVSILSPEEETELARRIRQGDKIALDKLTKANLRFVISVAKQYQGQGLPLTDLINEGNIGLIKAAEKFDATRGFKFISFAVWWIRQNILHAIAGSGRLVRMPLNKVTLSNRARRIQNALEQKFEREPSMEELAEAMNIEVDELELVMGNSGRHASLDAPTVQDQEGSLLDVLENADAPRADANILHHQSLHTELTRTLEVLPARQRETICYFFGIGVERPLALDDIARKYDLTTERVRQIKDKAISKLQTMQNFNLLRGFLSA